MSTERSASEPRRLSLGEIIKQRSQMVQNGPVSQRLKIDMDQARARQAEDAARGKGQSGAQR